MYELKKEMPCTGTGVNWVLLPHNTSRYTSYRARRGKHILAMRQKDPIDEAKRCDDDRFPNGQRS